MLRVKLAVTVRSLLMVTLHVPVPEQPPPDHPAKVEPVAAAAVSVTPPLWENGKLHVEPQLIPDGTDVTEPVPAPVFVMVRVCGTVSSVKEKRMPPWLGSVPPV